MGNMFEEIYDEINKREEIDPYDELVIFLPNNLNESKFLKKFPFDLRMDPPHSEIGMRHAHCRRMDNPSKQISYNIDGTRHDARKFCNSFPGLKNAQALIRREFKLPNDIMFEF